MDNETSRINFEIKSYSWKELACLYAPDLQPASATKRLHRWIMFNPKLQKSLVKVGWSKGQRHLTPLQVQILIDFLGEP